jgi:hypothetical protein
MTSLFHSLLDIRRSAVEQNFYGNSFAVLIATSVQRRDDQPPTPVVQLEPLHPVRGRLD